MPQTPYPRYSHWSQFVVWSDTEIRGFYGRDNYFFLSNFYPSPVFHNGNCWQTCEHAYQAAKLNDENYTEQEQDNLIREFKIVSTRGAMELGRSLKLSSKWNDIKFDIMLQCVLDKFIRNKELGQKLLDTNNKYLQELNNHGDSIWGVDVYTGIGDNDLGEILMAVRNYLIPIEKQ